MNDTAEESLKVLTGTNMYGIWMQEWQRGQRGDFPSNISDVRDLMHILLPLAFRILNF